MGCHRVCGGVGEYYSKSIGVGDKVVDGLRDHDSSTKLMIIFEFVTVELSKLPTMTINMKYTIYIYTILSDKHDFSYAIQLFSMYNLPQILNFHKIGPPEPLRKKEEKNS